MKNVEIDDDILDVWIGTKNEMNKKVKKDEFNGCAFFLGGIYFIYRKMYLIGTIDLILSIIGNIFIAIIAFGMKIITLSYISDFFILVIPIINGFLFYPLYKMHIRNILKKKKYENFDKVQIAQLKGGVNKAAAIIIGIIAVILVLCITYALLFQLAILILEAHATVDS